MRQQHYTPEQVGKVTEVYRKVIDNLDDFEWSLEYASKLTEITNRQQSIQSINY